MEGKRHRVMLADSGGEFFCGEDEFLLAAMRRAGFGPHGCHGGGCGICKMRLVSGIAHKQKRMSRAHVTAEEEAQGYVLTCCVQPRSDITLAEVGTKPTAEKNLVGGDKGVTITG